MLFRSKDGGRSKFSEGKRIRKRKRWRERAAEVSVGRDGIGSELDGGTKRREWT